VRASVTQIQSKNVLVFSNDHLKDGTGRFFTQGKRREDREKKTVVPKGERKVKKGASLSSARFQIASKLEEVAEPHAGEAKLTSPGGKGGRERGNPNKRMGKKT